VRHVIAVDLGGTNIRAARFVANDPHPVAQVRLSTFAARGREVVISRILDAVGQVAGDSPADLRIGIGAPGPLDPKRGIILEAPNLPGWNDVPLRAIVVEALHCPVAIGNDANLAALGEWRYGAGQGAQDVLYLTLSTGIGGGVICSGRLLEGFHGLAAELGHMTLDRNGPVCGCGKQGHLEALASGPAIARRAVELIRSGEPSSLARGGDDLTGLTAALVGEAARAGDSLAKRVVKEAGEAIGCHLASLMHAFDPEVIILGGGVSQMGDLLFEPIQNALRSHILHPRYLDGLRLVPAALGDEAGLIGAMALASDL
jgi:glucokinase